MNDVKLKTPSVLAFEAKLTPSDAVMFSGKLNGNEWKPILVREKSVRGTISNRLKAGLANDPLKIDAEVSKANLQTVDIASLPHDADTLKLVFTLRIQGGLDTPSACNCQNYQNSLAEKVSQYKKDFGFTELASRYAQNIANGRFLWKNRFGAEFAKVVVTTGNSKNRKEFSFDCYDFSLKEFKKSKELNALTKIIEAGLNGEHALLKIEAYSQLGDGQTVYPSQELVMNIKRGEKSKHLYQLDGQAAMHSQKIGNALRTVDTWFTKADEVGPISVEPYGSVTNRGIAYRQPKEGLDYYKLLDGWMTKGKEPSVEQKHYIMAMFIRGGVFGG